MKKFLSLLLAGSISTVNAVPVTLPDAKKLTETFNSLGLGDTNWANKFGGRKMESLSLPLDLTLAADEYDSDTEKPLISPKVKSMKPIILAALLEQSPGALEELMTYNLLK